MTIDLTRDLMRAFIGGPKTSIPDHRGITIEPHLGLFGAEYIRVRVDDRPYVLVRQTVNGWLYINDRTGACEYAPTQRDAVARALGVELPNWSDR